MSRHVFQLCDDAVDNIFNYRIPWDESYNMRYVGYINDLMGKDFYPKSWGSQFDTQDNGEVTLEEIEKLKMFAGPYGKTIYKAMKVKKK